MSDQSATEFGKELFADFESDAFFAPAFKPLVWIETVTTGDILSGTGTTTTETYTGNAAEQGSGAKKKMVQDVDGIYMTDVYVKASFADFAKIPVINEQVTYSGETFSVVYSQADPVLATFDLFLRA